MNLHDVIKINPEQTNAAIVVEQGLSNNALVAHYTPTQASIQVFDHFCKAVLPSATQEQRAINLYGSYGSGKSHLAVVLAHLLRDGAYTSGFELFLNRLHQVNQSQLAENLKNTFLAKNDADAKPYLLVSLYASGTTSLAAKLMEGLYDALERNPDLDIKSILPSTEYEVCAKRFEKIILEQPTFANADLSTWNLDHYISTEDLMFALKSHQPMALEVFLKWHEAVCFGQSFNIKDAGGKNFIDAYYEAGKNLSEKHHYSGIVVLWDEFGNALEDMIGNSARNAGQEIIDLQRFVETVCAPDLGHTLFIGVTHVSFQEYGDRTRAAEVIKEGLAKISGRFNKSFKIELNASESEGYHLLGMQKTWTEQGKSLIEREQPAKQRLLEHCRKLPLFQQLTDHLEQVVEEVYPLHPVMAVGLFNLSRLAQANRTALTFFRDNAGEILNREIFDHELWKQELVRLPQLVTYYADNLKKEAGSDWRRYEQAVGNVRGDTAEELQARKNILSLLLLAQLLGENFKASDELLACALYDSAPNTLAAEPMHQNLGWLKGAGLIWKNSVTNYWLLAGEGGVDIEALIEKQLSSFLGRSYAYLLETYVDMREDLFPTLGIHELEPSKCGIIRSYQIETLTPPFNHEQIKLTDPLLSARVFLVLSNDQNDVLTTKARIQEMPKKNIFFWVPVMGIESEIVNENNTILKLNDLLCRYLAINHQLKHGSALSEDLRRQMEAKWESNRQAIVLLLQNLYGRAGLESGKCQIYQAGVSEPLTHKSWHGFRSFLADEIASLYPNEVPIRAMNMNTLHDEKYCGSSKIVKIVERIIDFDENPTYQTDLLGETKDTSETSGLIDGILGANQLFTKRANIDCDIKRLDETTGVLKELLKSLHDSLLRKRDNPYLVSELRKKLISEPYGIPACTLPIFAAVAIRHESKRIRWGSTSERNFSKNLVAAFEPDCKLTIRLNEFGDKQFAMLFLAGQCLGVIREENQSNEDYANKCAAKLRAFVSSKPATVKTSNKLNVKTQQLVEFLSKVAQSNQDLADFLIELLEAKNDLPQTNISKVLNAVKDLLDDFLKVENTKLHEIRKYWTLVYPTNEIEKQTLIPRLKQIGTSRALTLVEYLRNSKGADEVNVKDLIQSLLYRSFDDCTDSDIGRFTGAIDALLEQCRKPISGAQNPGHSDGSGNTGYTGYTGYSGNSGDSGNGSPEKLKENIRTIIKSCELSDEEIVNVLEKILSDFAG